MIISVKWCYNMLISLARARTECLKSCGLCEPCMVVVVVVVDVSSIFGDCVYALYTRWNAYTPITVV